MDSAQIQRCPGLESQKFQVVDVYLLDIEGLSDRMVETLDDISLG